MRPVYSVFSGSNQGRIRRMRTPTPRRPGTEHRVVSVSDPRLLSRSSDLRDPSEVLGCDHEGSVRGDVRRAMSRGLVCSSSRVREQCQDCELTTRGQIRGCGCTNAPPGPTPSGARLEGGCRQEGGSERPFFFEGRPRRRSRSMMRRRG
jgi:hypothetical protein